MYFDYVVNIPPIKGKIITMTKKDSTYVLYQYAQKYNAAKRYSVPQRAVIGKCLGPDSNLMYPNERFQEFFPEAAATAQLPEVYRSCALRIGTYTVLSSLMKQGKLATRLKKWFPEHSGLIQDLVAYYVIEAENEDVLYSDYAYTHPLFADEMYIYSDQEIEQNLSSVSEEQIDAFKAEWKPMHSVFKPGSGISKTIIEVELTDPMPDRYIAVRMCIEKLALEMCTRMISQLYKSGLYPEDTHSLRVRSSAIRELERIEMVRRTQGRYQLDHALSKKQLALLDAFGLSELDIRNTAAEISQQLPHERIFVKKE